MRSAPATGRFSRLSACRMPSNESGGAAAHENEEVTGLGGALLLAVPHGRQPVAISRFTNWAMRRESAALGLSTFSCPRGASHGSARLGLLLGLQRPEFDRAQFVAAIGRVAQQVSRVGRADGEGRIGRKTLVSKTSSTYRRISGAERNDMARLGWVKATSASRARFELLRLVQEVLWIRALEGIRSTRFWSPSDEQRALPACPVAPQWRRQRYPIVSASRIFPLWRAECPGFIQQHVRDTAVELPPAHRHSAAWRAEQGGPAASRSGRRSPGPACSRSRLSKSANRT